MALQWQGNAQTRVLEGLAVTCAKDFNSQLSSETQLSLFSHWFTFKDTEFLPNFSAVFLLFWGQGRPVGDGPFASNMFN